MHKLISVITINYNHLEGLKNTFKSIVNQTDKQSIEWIVIDGNSTDGSAEFLREHQNEIDVLEIAKDKGIYDAMNKGLALATGTYVWFMNGGDTVYANDVFEKALQSIRIENCDILYSDTMFVSPEMEQIGLISDLKPQTLPENLNFSSFRFGMNLCHQSFIVRRSLCDPYDLQYKQAADVDWIVNILKKKPKAFRCNFILSNFEVGGSSYQYTKKAWRERFNVLTKHYGLLPNLFAHVWIIIRRVLFNLKLKLKL